MSNVVNNSLSDKEDGGARPRGVLGHFLRRTDRLGAAAAILAFHPDWTPEQALEELSRGAGAQFCPRCMKGLDTILDDARERAEQLRAV